MAPVRIPATVITGFLGAGKTTLIRNIIMQANGKRLALIVNEFGDIGMDGDMLQECGADSCSAEDIIELANGCICCTVADDFLPSIKQLLAHGASATKEGYGGLAPLHHALIHLREPACHALLEAGADPNQADSGGHTALSIAKRMGYSSIVALLEEHQK